MKIKRGPKSSKPLFDDSKIIDLASKKKDIFAKSIKELSPKHLEAARLDAAGLDIQSIANSADVSISTISLLRTNKDYISARNLIVEIIHRYSIQFRMECHKHILAPVYAKLISRVNDKDKLEDMSNKEILEIIKVIGRETRFDQAQSGGSEDSDDLQELQKIRRKDFSVAKQAQEVDRLMNNDKIISMPNTASR